MKKSAVATQLLLFPAKTLKEIVVLLSSFGIYFLIFQINFPKELSLQLRYGFFDTLIVISIIFYISFLFKGLTGIFLSLSTILIIFGLTLTALWQNSLGEMHVLGGLIYFSDTFYLYSESMNLLDGGLFHSISARRPLFSGFLASISLFTGRNLQFTLCLLVAINALACFFLAHEIRRTHGHNSATFLMVVLFFFYRRFIGTTDTENLGFALGTLGLALLWRSSYTASRNAVLLGVALVTLGLIARAGTFLVILFILLWVAGQTQHGIFTQKTLALSIIAVVMCFLVNEILSRTLTDGRGMLFSNFPQHLYGIVLGGKGWEQVFKDYPYLALLPEANSASIIYELIWTNFIKSPWVAFSGMAHSLMDFFSLRDESVFGFMSGGELIFLNQINQLKQMEYLAFRSMLYILGFMGFMHCWRGRKDPTYLLTLFFSVGILFSVPVLPPKDSGLMRVYAATIPMIAIIPMMGLFSIAGHERFSSKATSDQIERNSQLPLIYGISLVCSITVISVLVRFTARSPEIGSIECPPDLQTLYVRINPGATLNIVGNLEPVGNIPLNIHKNAFVKSIDAFPYGALISPLKQLNPPFAITAAVDIHTRQYLWLIVNQSLEVNSPRSLAVCGIWNQDLLSNGLSFFYAKDIYRGIGVP